MKKQFLFICISILSLVLLTSNASAISALNLFSIENNSIYYDSQQVPSSCGLTTTISTSVNGSVSATTSQQQVIQTIIGIAKYEGLGQAGALIGLMVAQDESGMQIYANSNVPLSLSVAHNAVGTNGDSVGIYQQQPQYDWSTLATGQAALNNLSAITQLMSPAYAAEAFFGTPPGTNLTGLANPAALNKGVQNIPGWQNLTPEEVGQEVQNPGPPNPGNLNYQNELKNSLPQAQAYLTKYWNSSPSVTPPVPFSGGSLSPAANGTCGININCNSSSLSSASTPITGAQASIRQQVVCLAEQQLAVWKNQPGYPWNGVNTYSEKGYLIYSQNNVQEWCADFVSWIYQQAGYPLQPDPNWRLAAVVDIQSVGEQNLNFQWHPKSSGYVPQPGDLAIYGAGHVNMFISNQNGISTYIGGDQGSGPYPGGSIVSIETGIGYYDNGITGYVSPN